MITEIEKNDKTIGENHRADLENGLTEQAAAESDAFERRVLGLPSAPTNSSQFGLVLMECCCCDRTAYRLPGDEYYCGCVDE